MNTTDILNMFCNTEKMLLLMELGWWYQLDETQSTTIMITLPFVVTTIQPTRNIVPIHAMCSLSLHNASFLQRQGYKIDNLGFFLWSAVGITCLCDMVMLLS